MLVRASSRMGRASSWEANSGALCDALPPARPVAVSGTLGGVVVPVVLREGAIVAAIEHDTRQLGWVDDVERGFDQLARCLVGRHHQEKAIDPFRDDSAVRRWNNRR